MKKFKQTISVFIFLGVLLFFTAFPVYSSESPQENKSKDPRKMKPPINVKVEVSESAESPRWKVCDPGKSIQGEDNKAKQPVKAVKKTEEAAQQPAGSNGPAKIEDEKVSAVGSDVLTVTPESGEPPLKLTLEKALELAGESDNDLKIAIARIKSAEGKFYEAKSAKNVTLDVLGTYNRIDPVSEVSLGGGADKPAAKMKLGANDNFSGKLILQKIITTFGNLENTINASILTLPLPERILRRPARIWSTMSTAIIIRP